MIIIAFHKHIWAHVDSCGNRMCVITAKWDSSSLTSYLTTSTLPYIFKQQNSKKKSQILAVQKLTTKIAKDYSGTQHYCLLFCV